MATHTQRVVTWSTPRGLKIDLCPACEERLRAEGTWPRDPATGEEYCSVTYGRHEGLCSIAVAEERRPE